MNGAVVGQCLWPDHCAANRTTVPRGRRLLSAIARRTAVGRAAARLATGRFGEMLFSVARFFAAVIVPQMVVAIVRVGQPGVGDVTAARRKRRRGPTAQQNQQSERSRFHRGTPIRKGGEKILQPSARRQSGPHIRENLIHMARGLITAVGVWLGGHSNMGHAPPQSKRDC